MEGNAKHQVVLRASEPTKWEPDREPPSSPETHVQLPPAPVVAIEDTRERETVAYGRAEVRLVDGPFCGFWEGKTLYLGLGEICIEIALEANPEPGWCSMSGYDPLNGETCDLRRLDELLEERSRLEQLGQVSAVTP